MDGNHKLWLIVKQKVKQWISKHVRWVIIPKSILFLYVVLFIYYVKCVFRSKTKKMTKKIELNWLYLWERREGPRDYRYSIKKNLCSINNWMLTNKCIHEFKIMDIRFILFFSKCYCFYFILFYFFLLLFFLFIFINIDLHYNSSMKIIRSYIAFYVFFCVFLSDWRYQLVENSIMPLS